MLVDHSLNVDVMTGSGGSIIPFFRFQSEYIAPSLHDWQSDLAPYLSNLTSSSENNLISRYSDLQDWDSIIFLKK